ncbi:MAG: hypothetical protein ABI024_06720 [Vicinamibacterales bacterium]
MKALRLAENREPGTGHLIGVIAIVIAMWHPNVVAAFEQHDAHQPASPRANAPRLPDPASRLPDLGWEPIRCWRQSSAGAISVGETFTLVLTCAVFEGENAQVIPDESRLGVASIQMAPFEILGGAHPPDVHRGSRRFFQYDYQLRIIGPDAIGRDANIPPLSISYRIHSRVGAAATLEGRDLTYLMPMLPIKVLSLVPMDAADIRDASEASLAVVDSLRYRSNLFQVLALTFAALAAVMGVVALLPLARSTTTSSSAERGRVPDRAIVACAADDLVEVQSSVTAGWTDDLISRALGAMRLIAAAAIDRPISQTALIAGAAPPEGRLRVQHGAVRSTIASVSSPVTADDLGRARSERTRVFSTTRQQQLEGLQAGLSTLAGALYRKVPARDTADLDDSVRHAISVAREIANERSWWKSRWPRR